MIYDVVIIWAGAAGLFAWINLDKKLSKIILEKTEKPWMKVLLSWGERANVSNMDIEATRDYFTQNKKFLLSIFSKYNQWDIMWFFAEKWINIVEEDRSRLILESWDSRELLNCLLDEVKKNNCEIKLSKDVKNILKLDNWNFEISLDNWEKYLAKNVIVSSWWKSFSHIWTTGEWYNFAKNLWLKIITPYRTLCWMATKRDLSEISWVSSNVEMSLVDSNPSSFVTLQRLPLKKEDNKRKIIYKEKWPILFTHFWVSWPIIHNLSNAIWEYLNSLKINESEFENYILNNLSLDIKFDLENIPKRIVKFFNLSDENISINLELQNWRSWKEAKATGWWIDTDELDNNMQIKKYPWLYFIWEFFDVTWKTWWFNLQWAWSSAYVASKNI